MPQAMSTSIQRVAIKEVDGPGHSGGSQCHLGEEAQRFRYSDCFEIHRCEASGQQENLEG